MASECHTGRQQDSFQLSSVLSSALFEWFLMFLLFVNALFSYLVTKFARYCKLQTPCLLCSRLDHIFGNEKPGFYGDLICNSHKAEISSLAYCRAHRNLASINEMCEACLISSATKKSDPEIYRLLLAKLDTDIDFSAKLNGEDLVEVPLLQKNHCFCCSMPFISKSHDLLQNNPVRVDRLSKKMENSVGSPSTHHLGDHGFDRLSRVGYSEVKITSDSESENPLSDNDDVNKLSEGVKEDVADQWLKPESGVIIPNDSSMPPSDGATMEKLTHKILSKIESSLSIPEEQFLQAGESHDVAAGHSLEEVNWTKNEASDSPALPEIISQKDTSESPKVKLNGSIHSVGENTKTLNSTTYLASSQLVSDPGQSGLAHMDLNDACKLATCSKGSLTSPTVTEVIIGRDSSKVYGDLRLLVSQFPTARGIGSPWNESSPSPRVLSQGDDFKFSDPSSAAILQSKGSLTSPTVTEVITGRDSSKVYGDLRLLVSQFSAARWIESPRNESSPSPRVPSQGDASNPAIPQSKGTLTSPTVTEVITGRDSSKVYGDLRLLVTQFSAARGIESPWNELSPSPRVLCQGDDFKFSDPSSPAILQNITKSLSIERNESGLESLDGSIVSEIEGESAVDRLKRQVELDRKSMYLMYKELEEERSASAIAANQAMAMITRLQEEKASMHMEALQYQRMMEEQSEYDQEALQRLNDLVVQREKEMQDLESELETYRKSVGDKIRGNLSLGFDDD